MMVVVMVVVVEVIVATVVAESELEVRVGYICSILHGYLGSPVGDWQFGSF